MQLIADAGWVDLWAEAGTGDGLTWPAVGPFERIDWVWHTPDMHAVDASVPATTASDHLPLLVSLEGRPMTAAPASIPRLTTERLVLRPLTLADAADVQRLAGDRAVAETTAHDPAPVSRRGGRGLDRNAC